MGVFFMALSYAFSMLLTALSEGVLNIFYGLLCAPNNHFCFPPRRALGIFWLLAALTAILMVIKAPSRLFLCWPSCVSC